MGWFERATEENQRWADEEMASTHSGEQFDGPASGDARRAKQGCVGGVLALVGLLLLGFLVLVGVSTIQWVNTECGNVTDESTCHVKDSAYVWAALLISAAVLVTVWVLIWRGRSTGGRRRP